MHERILHALKTHRPALLARWEMLLRAEDVATPLGNPDTLVHLMHWSLDCLDRELARPRLRRRPTGRPSASDCACGRNPLLRYFATAERALVETLFVNSAELEGLDSLAREAGLHELKRTLNHISHAEIESLCSVCRHRLRPADHGAKSVLNAPVGLHADDPDTPSAPRPRYDEKLG